MDANEIRETPAEKWRDVVGFDGFYQVSNLGNVRSYLGWRGKKMRYSKPKKPHLSKQGYRVISLKGKERRDPLRVARLVCAAFYPNPEGKPYVNHKNGIRDDDRAENLEWCTPSENTLHAYRTGLAKVRYGTDIACSRLDPEKVTTIRSMIAEGIDCKVIASSFGVALTTIKDVRKGRTWGHVPGLLSEEPIV